MAVAEGSHPASPCSAALLNSGYSGSDIMQQAGRYLNPLVYIKKMGESPFAGRFAGYTTFDICTSSKEGSSGNGLLRRGDLWNSVLFTEAGCGNQEW
jgi:hypothetical protein